MCMVACHGVGAGAGSGTLTPGPDLATLALPHHRIPSIPKPMASPTM